MSSFEEFLSIYDSVKFVKLRKDVCTIIDHIEYELIFKIVTCYSESEYRHYSFVVNSIIYRLQN